PPPPDFGITVRTITTATGGELQVTGHAFTPGGALQIAYANIPNRPGSLPAGGQLPLVSGNGTFFYSEAFNCTSHDASEVNALVLVSATDVTTGHFAAANVRAGTIWVHPELPSCQ